LRGMIRILLAEDQAMVRGALGALLKMERDIEVLGAAADGMQALSECRRLKPDIVVTDIEMPGMTGIELAQKIQADNMPCKVVIVTTFARQGYLRRALDAVAVCGQALFRFHLHLFPGFIINSHWIVFWHEHRAKCVRGLSRG
jgi:two-component system response regulator DesR